LDILSLILPVPVSALGFQAFAQAFNLWQDVGRRVMGVLLAWVVGYVVGAKGGSEDFDDVVQAVKELRDSDEVRQLLSVVGSHIAHVLHSTAQVLEQVPTSQPTSDLVDRVRLLVKRG
jgi:hypothetical protein